MKKYNHLFAFLWLMLPGCNQSEEPAQMPTEHIVTLTAELPPETACRLDPTIQGAGLSFTWSKDYAYFYFKYKEQFYVIRQDNITPVASNPRKAVINIKIPKEIPTDALFDFYCVLQKDPAGYIYNPHDGSFILPDYEHYCITLDKRGYGAVGIIRPIFYHAQKNATLTTIGKISFRHTGVVIAVHFKNKSGKEMNVPDQIFLKDLSEKKFFFDDLNKPWIEFYPESNTFQSDDMTSFVTYSLNRDVGLLSPYLNMKMASEEEKIFYRFIPINGEETTLPELNGIIKCKGGTSKTTTPTKLPKRKVKRGHVYHIYTEWDGTNFTFVKK